MLFASIVKVSLLAAVILVISILFYWIYVFLLNEPIFVETEDVGGSPTEYPLTMVFADGNLVYTRVDNLSEYHGHFQLDTRVLEKLKESIGKVENFGKTRFQLYNMTDQGDVAFYIKGAHSTSFWDIYPYYTDYPGATEQYTRIFRDRLKSSGATEVIMLLDLVKDMRPQIKTSDNVWDRLIALKWNNKVPKYQDREFR